MTKPTKISFGIADRTNQTKLKKLNKEVLMPEQIHGAKVVWVREHGQGRLPGCDGLITALPGLKIGVRTADCVPMLLFAEKAGIIAALHAGWRGTLKNIVAQAVKQFQKAGVGSAEIKAIFGPYIGMCCYEVDADVARPFQRRFPKNQQVIYKNNLKWQINLAYANYLELLAVGVKKNNIQMPFYCTRCQNERFFSYRQEGRGKPWRQVISFITQNA